MKKYKFFIGAFLLGIVLCFSVSGFSASSSQSFAGNAVLNDDTYDNSGLIAQVFNIEPKLNEICCIFPIYGSQSYVYGASSQYSSCSEIFYLSPELSAGKSYLFNLERLFEVTDINGANYVRQMVSVCNQNNETQVGLIGAPANVAEGGFYIVINGINYLCTPSAVGYGGGPAGYGQGGGAGGAASGAFVIAGDVVADVDLGYASVNSVSVVKNGVNYNCIRQGGEALKQVKVNGGWINVANTDTEGNPINCNAPDTGLITSGADKCGFYDNNFWINRDPVCCGL